MLSGGGEKEEINYKKIKNNIRAKGPLITTPRKAFNSDKPSYNGWRREGRKGLVHLI